MSWWLLKSGFAAGEGQNFTLYRHNLVKYLHYSKYFKHKEWSVKAFICHFCVSALQILFWKQNSLMLELYQLLLSDFASLYHLPAPGRETGETEMKPDTFSQPPWLLQAAWASKLLEYCFAHSLNYIKNITYYFLVILCVQYIDF